RSPCPAPPKAGARHAIARQAPEIDRGPSQYGAADRASAAPRKSLRAPSASQLTGTALPSASPPARSMAPIRNAAMERAGGDALGRAVPVNCDADGARRDLRGAADARSAAPYWDGPRSISGACRAIAWRAPAFGGAGHGDLARQIAASDERAHGSGGG